jgi:hypothetical protein
MTKTRRRKNRTTDIPDPYWRAVGLPVPTREYVFASPRRWRFDFCFIEKKLAVEIEGGIFTMGAHTRGAGFAGDMEKYNAAALLGYRILRYTPSKINFDEIRMAFNQ